MSALRPVLCAKAARCPLAQHCRRNPAVSGVVDGDVFGQWTPPNAGSVDEMQEVIARIFDDEEGEARARKLGQFMRGSACAGFLGLGEA